MDSRREKNTALSHEERVGGVCINIYIYNIYVYPPALT